jgi:hypothetical protein
VDIASAVALGAGKTCIDCHKGIAHQLPPIDRAIGAPRTGPTAGKFAPPQRLSRGAGQTGRSTGVAPAAGAGGDFAPPCELASSLPNISAGIGFE